MKTHYKKTIIAVALGILIALGGSYASALSRPTKVGANNPAKFITVGSTAQPKIGQMNMLSLMVGDYGNVMSNNVSVFDNLGGMAVGKRTTTSGIALDVVGTTGITGSIKSSALAFSGSGKRPICTDADGKLFTCNVIEYKASSTQTAGSATRYDSFMVPEGVSSITVEVYGAGGAGYGSANAATGLDDGDSSYFKGGNNVVMIAGGGSGASFVASPGLGGSSSVTINGVASPSSPDGAKGDVPNSSTNSNPSQYGSVKTCNGTNYYILKGGTGDAGAAGGQSAFDSSEASGGAGGLGGPLSSAEYTGFARTWSFINNTLCNFTDKSSDDSYLSTTTAQFNRPGANGSDGSIGGGGGGFGGRGGASELSNATSCSASDDGCFGGGGAAGGGAGAYAKATFSVSTGQTFFVKVGGGGIPKEKTCTLTTAQCLQLKYKGDGGGAVSGKGGDGYIKITY